MQEMHKIWKNNASATVSKYLRRIVPAAKRHLLAAEPVGFGEIVVEIDGFAFAVTFSPVTPFEGLSILPEQTNPSPWTSPLLLSWGNGHLNVEEDD